MSTQIEKSDRYVISDCHFGMANISSFRKLKKLDGSLMSSEEQHEVLYETLALVPKRATLWLLGDIAFNKEWLGRIKKLPCRNKILLVGNHDLDRKDVVMGDLVETYDQVYALHKYKGCWMSHAPIHPMELRGKLCMHGHLHYALVEDDRFRNVSAEYTGFKPVPWEFALSDEYYQECLKRHTEYMLNRQEN